MNFMHQINESQQVRVGILTVSDTRTEETDRSGQAIQALLETKKHQIEAYSIVLDELSLIQTTILEWIEQTNVQAIIINGGTGFSPRDVTYEAVSTMLNKQMDGFGELFRVLSYEDIGAKAMFSRAIAGSINETAVYALPGSTNAVTLALEKLILPTIAHFVEELVKR